MEVSPSLAMVIVGVTMMLLPSFLTLFKREMNDLQYLFTMVIGNMWLEGAVIVSVIG